MGLFQGFSRHTPIVPATSDRRQSCANCFPSVSVLGAEAAPELPTCAEVVTEHVQERTSSLAGTTAAERLAYARLCYDHLAGELAIKIVDAVRLGGLLTFAGVMRSPFTSIVFALELTHDVNALLALLVACTIAHLVSVLTLKRSILTEKIARRGYHVTREYEIDPLHALLMRDVMATDVLSVDPLTPTAELYERLPEGGTARRQRLYPVLDSEERLVGVLAFSDLIAARHSPRPIKAGEIACQPMLAFADETLREVADRMVSSGHGVLPVTDREDPQRLVGLISHFDLLKAHERVLVEERHRERPLGPRRLAPGLGVLPWMREPAK
jgi:CBS domain-containing protein